MKTDHTSHAIPAAAEPYHSTTSGSYVTQSPEETRHTVEELMINQVELETLNEELHSARYDMQTVLEKYIDLYESAPFGYFTLNQAGSIIAVNLTGSNILRIERTLLPGQNFEQYIAEEYRATFTAFLRTVFSGRDAEACEVVLLNNVSLPVRVQIGAVVTDSGEECRLALIDISGQEEVEPQLENSGSAGVPADRIELELSVCSLRAALDASLMKLWEKALRSGLDIQMDLAPVVDERIVADQVKLEQIIFGLLANAIRFTPAGGVVRVSAVRDGDVIKITIADSGIGISTDDIPNLFQAFTQQESIYTKECEGTGLGLTLTRQLVELHGGTLSVESELGTGSRFCFTIPLRNCAGIT